MSKSKSFGMRGPHVKVVTGGKYEDREYPVKLVGVIAGTIHHRVKDARRLHKHLGAALEYIDAQEGAEQ